MQSSALGAAYMSGLGVSHPRWIPDIPQLVAAIDGRLAAIAAEITALDAAKAQLAAPRRAPAARRLLSPPTP